MEEQIDIKNLRDVGFNITKTEDEKEIRQSLEVLGFTWRSGHKPTDPIVSYNSHNYILIDTTGVLCRSHTPDDYYLLSKDYIVDPIYMELNE